MADQKQIAQTIDSIISQLSALKDMLSGMPSAEPPQEALRKAEQGLCLVCGRELSQFKTRPSRGCHAHCYKQVMNKIKDGALTEDEAIETGLLLKEKTGGRPAFVDLDAMIKSRRETSKSAAEEAKERAKSNVQAVKDATTRKKKQKPD